MVTSFCSWSHHFAHSSAMVLTHGLTTSRQLTVLNESAKPMRNSLLTLYRNRNSVEIHLCCKATKEKKLTIRSPITPTRAVLWTFDSSNFAWGRAPLPIKMISAERVGSDEVLGLSGSRSLQLLSAPSAISVLLAAVFSVSITGRVDHMRSRCKPVANAVVCWPAALPVLPALRPFTAITFLHSTSFSMDEIKN